MRSGCSEAIFSQQLLSERNDVEGVKVVRVTGSILFLSNFSRILERVHMKDGLRLRAGGYGAALEESWQRTGAFSLTVSQIKSRADSPAAWTLPQSFDELIAQPVAQTRDRGWHVPLRAQGCRGGCDLWEWQAPGIR